MKKLQQVFSTVGLKKRHSINKEYFPELKSLGGKGKVESDLPNYATKTNLKSAKGYINFC